MTIERPMFPPRADSTHAFCVQPAVPQPKTRNRTSESANPFEGLDLAMLRFVRCLIRGRPANFNLGARNGAQLLRIVRMERGCQLRRPNRAAG
jgi:hypothetical protein